MKPASLKRVLFWCPRCNIPLLARQCSCGETGKEIPLLQPYDVRPALDHDRDIIRGLLRERFGTDSLPRIVLFNKTGGTDRTDLIIANGERFGWLSFDPCTRSYSLEVLFEALDYLAPTISTGIIDITDTAERMRGRRLGGKRIEVASDIRDGCVILRAGNLWGTGQISGGSVRVRKLGPRAGAAYPDPAWEDAVRQNRRHIKNLERHALRFIRQQTRDHKQVNVSFSGGKDSTVVLELAKRAGIEEAYFINTGLEFPETLEYVRSRGIREVRCTADFWEAVQAKGLPAKDDRWCCEMLKLEPARQWLAPRAPCITVQGNRAYESFARANLPAVAPNPYFPRQVNISPILNWRALEVFLYIWWRDLPCNPLYNDGFERVGCWICPAMLESELERTREIHPDLVSRWEEVLHAWAASRGLDERIISCGIWRWKTPPPKIRELAREHGIKLPDNGMMKIRKKSLQPSLMKSESKKDL
ncbi:MAG: phosphoadenosine phosphosulfate reductase family protein [Methanomicrobiaceae archaeon]|nr:phosphoadenosine phosphosulfate reductase family protein [Methanomicrobiaceae archaeon]